MPPGWAMSVVVVPWKFHHESWDTPWTSQTGDFPPEETDREHGLRRRELRQELRSKHDDISQLLKSELSRWPWGYTIYRTVYTPESDIYWEAAVDAIRANIFATLDYELQHANLESKNEKAHRILRDGYRSLVFEDKSQLDRATIDQVAKKFKNFLDGKPGTSGTRFRWCLMIDERALRSFIRHPEPVQFSAPPSQGGVKKNGAWVTVVDPEWDPDTAPTRSKYQGFMRCHLLELEELALLGSLHHMSEMIHWDRSTGIPWYEDKI
jgi:hypothetical protein